MQSFCNYFPVVLSIQPCGMHTYYCKLLASEFCFLSPPHLLALCSSYICLARVSSASASLYRSGGPCRAARVPKQGGLVGGTNFVAKLASFLWPLSSQPMFQLQPAGRKGSMTATASVLFPALRQLYSSNLLQLQLFLFLLPLSSLPSTSQLVQKYVLSVSTAQLGTPNAKHFPMETNEVCVTKGSETFVGFLVPSLHRWNDI